MKLVDSDQGSVSEKKTALQRITVQGLQIAVEIIFQTKNLLYIQRYVIFFDRRVYQ